MAAKKEKLEVRELLKRICLLFAQNHSIQRITFPEKRPSTKIGKGRYKGRYIMCYETSNLVLLGKRLWIMTTGEVATYIYPIDLSRYTSTFLALELGLENLISENGSPREDIKERVNARIERSNFYSDPLIYGLSDGNIAASKRGRHFQELSEILKGTERFITQKPERGYTLNGEPLLITPLMYDPKFVDFLYSSIKNLLI